jgi:hypothetical protein
MTLMMKFSSIIAGLILIVVLSNSCKQSQSITASEDGYQYIPDSIKLIIQAVDLTEDMSSLSSKNDELTILIYEVIDPAKLVVLKYSNSFTMTKRSDFKKLAFSNSFNVNGKTYSVVLIERDTDQTTDEIEKMVSSRYFELTSYYLKNGNFGIEEFLDDNDIVGIKIINDLGGNNEVDFRFSGFFKLDKYEYRLTVVK